MVGNVEDELAESFRTSTTVLHGPVQVDFDAPSCKSIPQLYITKVHMYTYVYPQAQ